MSSSKQIQLLKKIPTFRAFILQRHVLDSIHHSVAPPLYSYSCQASIPLLDCHSFNFLITRVESSGRRVSYKTLSRTELLKKFLEFSSPLIEEGISIYTDGSKFEDSPVRAAVYSLELGLALKHKLPADTSIFSAEA